MCGEKKKFRPNISDRSAETHLLVINISNFIRLTKFKEALKPQVR